ncbi:hypothetical protein EDD36DRAFT_208852 [Exophiala viscosa]|uniref:Uncharacterized protein n=1 Tax=Exophiala viscosa TaxID=2486360 RepID=A0AAN6DYP2_9EURO|nr:hypothetical protein EDD36DRAFT_208852 [Exophiala viscosa]
MTGRWAPLGRLIISTIIVQAILNEKLLSQYVGVCALPFLPSVGRTRMGEAYPLLPRQREEFNLCIRKELQRNLSRLSRPRLFGLKP